MHQKRIDPSRLVFIDETWAKTNMTRTHGYAPVGQRLIGRVPHGHWKTMTFLAALRADRIDAPCVFDGPINGERFLAYVEQALVPTLRPGDVVVMDNLGSHKGQGVRRASARRREALLPAALQPRSQPDRTGLRQAQDPPAEGRGALAHLHLAADRQAPRPLPPDECSRYLRNAGYAAT